MRILEIRPNMYDFSSYGGAKNRLEGRMAKWMQVYQAINFTFIGS